MKILVAPDSFKESLSARWAACMIGLGILKVDFSIEALLVPMADGGEGSMEILVENTNGRIVKLPIHNSLRRPICASYGILGDGETVIVESASAIGLGLLKQEERNPFQTSSYGVGEFICYAVEAGYRKIVVCAGGTSTNDGGAGMLQALGCKLYKSNGEPIGLGNQALADLHSIDASKMLKLLDKCELILAADVTNPLLGNAGATYTFAKQKGAKSGDLPELERNMQHYAEVVKQTVGNDYSTCPGAGAGGGIGFALMALMGAKMRKGVELVMELLNMEELIANADVIYTGEGSIDRQTAFGKVISGIVSLAKKYDKPVVAFCGKKVGDMSGLHKAGLTAVFSIADSPMSLQESMDDAVFLLKKQAEEVTRLLLSGINIKKKL